MFSIASFGLINNNNILLKKNFGEFNEIITFFFSCLKHDNQLQLHKKNNIFIVFIVLCV